MRKVYSILLATLLVNSFSYANSIEKSQKTDCYKSKIKIEKRNYVSRNHPTFKDTTILFHNYVENIDNKRNVCGNIIIDKEIYKLIWESKYLNVYLKYQEKNNQFSILWVQSAKNSKLFATYYLCQRKTREAIAMIKFEILNNKITGINILPAIYDGFVPIEDFENQDNVMIE